jgi:hypothetical protein
MAGGIHYFAAALATLVFLAGGVLTGLRIPKRAAVPLLGVWVAAAAARAVLMLRPDWETRAFPWPAYAFYQRHWVFPMGCFILGYAGGRLPVRWNRAMIWSLGGLLFGWSLASGAWMLREPCPGERGVPPRGAMTVQSTEYNCAPAVCATLLRCWGIDESEHRMAQLCLCTPGKGTNLFDKYRGLKLAAEGSGLRARVASVRLADLGRLVRPFAIGAHGHAMLVFEVRAGGLLVGDPFEERPFERKLENLFDEDQDDVYVFLLCREHPFDGRDAPHLAEWVARETGRGIR